MSSRPWVITTTDRGGTETSTYLCHDCEPGNATFVVSWTALRRHYESEHPDSKRLNYVNGQANAYGMSGVPQVIRCAAGLHTWTPWRWVSKADKRIVDDRGCNKTRRCLADTCRAAQGKWQEPPSAPPAVPGPHRVGSMIRIQHPGGKNGWTRAHCGAPQCLFETDSPNSANAEARVRGHANAANAALRDELAKLLRQAKGNTP